MNGWKSIQKTRFFRVIAVGSVLAIVLAWNPQVVWHPVRAVLGFVAVPFQRAFSVVGFYTASSSEFLASIGTLKQDNERLMSENMRLISENAKLSDMQSENEMLRKEIDLLPREKFRLKAAEVIGLDQQSTGNWILIDKGSMDGIRTDMVVIVNQGVVVGRVSDVSINSAKVVLVTSPESAVNGADAQTEAMGIVRGRYGLGLVMDMVLLTDTLKQGDAVVTSGLGGDFPRGLFLGKVDAVQPSSDRLFQQATLVPAVNFLKLRTVFVIEDAL